MTAESKGDCGGIEQRGDTPSVTSHPIAGFRHGVTESADEIRSGIVRKLADRSYGGVTSLGGSGR